jgi:AcrR family transcriptional regulator
MMVAVTSAAPIPSRNRTGTLLARKRELVKDAIWGAAIDLFASRGYDQTTIEQIVHAAGVSQRSFFRYFSSKSDVIAQGMVSYGDAVVAAIDGCPRSFSLPEVLEHTVVAIARDAAAHTHSRKTMEVLAKYPAARAAEVSRLPGIQDRVSAAFGRRCKDDATAQLLSGLTLQIVSVALRSWFAHPERDAGAAAEQALAVIRRLFGGSAAPAKRREAASQKPRIRPK